MFRKLKEFILLHRVRKLADTSIADMGKLIDMPMKRFKQYIKHKKLNAGQTKLLIDEFEDVYVNMVDRKDGIIKVLKVTSNEKKRKKLIDTINRIYVVLSRLEQRIVWLRSRYNHLLGDI